MFRILCKSVHTFGTTTSEPHILLTLGFQQFSSSSTKPVNQDSFTVQYLINEIGFSLEKAVIASKHLHFESRDKPDAVVSFFKNQGFTHLQIRTLISAHARILVSNPERILLPKMEFFRSKGVSSTALVRMIALNATLLTRSLEKFIVPSFNFYTHFFGSDQSVTRMLIADSRLLSNVEVLVKPNIEILLRDGVPHSCIASILKIRPSMFIRTSDEIEESIKQVRKIGMDDRSITYCLAISILASTRTSKWNEKMKAYKRWGCSEDEVLKAFKILPWIMTLSQEKIDRVMIFSVNEMGWQPSEVVRTYFLLTLSLNKRIMPRWSVYQELVSKRLVKGKDSKFRKMCNIKEDLFLEKYVNCYKNEAPMLMKLYLEKMEASKQ